MFQAHKPFVPVRVCVFDSQLEEENAAKIMFPLPNLAIRK